MSRIVIITDQQNRQKHKNCEFSQEMSKFARKCLISVNLCSQRTLLRTVLAGRVGVTSMNVRRQAICKSLKMCPIWAAEPETEAELDFCGTEKLSLLGALVTEPAKLVLFPQKCTERVAASCDGRRVCNVREWCLHLLSCTSYHAPSGCW